MKISIEITEELIESAMKEMNGTRDEVIQFLKTWVEGLLKHFPALWQMWKAKGAIDLNKAIEAIHQKTFQQEEGNAHAKGGPEASS